MTPFLAPRVTLERTSLTQLTWVRYLVELVEFINFTVLISSRKKKRKGTRNRWGTERRGKEFLRFF